MTAFLSYHCAEVDMKCHTWVSVYFCAFRKFRGGGGERERKTATETDTEIESKTERLRDRQRQTDRQIERVCKRDRTREIERILFFSFQFFPMVTAPSPTPHTQIIEIVLSNEPLATIHPLILKNSHRHKSRLTTSKYFP